MNIFSSIKHIINDEGSYPFKKWLFIAFFIKAVLFFFYALNFHWHPETSIARGLFYVEGGDTFTYYPPLIDFCNGLNYGNACRMPGLAPVFVPIYWITKNQELSYSFVIIFQFILSTISVYLLGLVAHLIFNSKRIFIITVILYSLFYHIADHYLMADSQANSTLIIAAFYFLLAYKNDFKLKYIFISGGFFCWSIFSRVIAIMPFITVLFIIAFILIIKRKQLIKAIKVAFAFVSIFIVFESLWIVRNKIALGKTIVFTVPECYSTFSYNWLEYAKIPMVWGYETTPWVGEIDWFLKENNDNFNYPKSVFTKSFNLDSLKKIKTDYYYYKSKNEGIYSVTESFKKNIANYIDEYKRENKLNYYLINPVKLVWKFHFKKSIVLLPFPKVEHMSLFQKIIKVLNWGLFTFCSLGILIFAPLLLLFKRSVGSLVLVIIPFSITFFLACLFGAIEQRYFLPLIPFAIIINSFFINIFLNKFTSLMPNGFMIWTKDPK